MKKKQHESAMPTLKCRKTLIVVGAFTKGTLGLK